MISITISPTSALKGTICIPGDKYISHRSAMMGVLAQGETRVEGFFSAQKMNRINRKETDGI